MDNRGLDKDSVFFILKDLKNDIKSLDEKWETYLKETGASSASLKSLVLQVEELKKIVQIGNGQPSLLHRVSALARCLDEVKAVTSSQTQTVVQLKDTVDSLAEDIALLKRQVGVPTPKEVKVERWKTLGKALGVIGLTLPGIISWLSSI